ncbi:hypothetical protein BD94_2749 [Elizabethkingia anophelis NUHP1]|uniref:Uncharacterized protein n=1 Tax=Elizabethkingia anophelis NUHP1 TaxID=1338011 RepID=A0A077EJZ3_9FLAO|nr:hypothetical protein BD94_2749 [Elizabethkingia anophelis NUHP1]
MSRLIGGQLQSGFLIKGFHGSSAPVSRFLIEDYMPGFIATWSLKL